MLARALSHDLSMGRLRDLWLENADVAELSHRKRERTDLASGFFGRSSGRPAEFIGDPEARSSCRCSCGRAGSSHRSAG